jgi:ABC-2 type transport system ATP-binding protein
VAAGTDVLLTTQYLDEADQLATHLAIIDHGRVIAEGTPPELKAQAGRDMIEVHARSRDDLDRLAGALAPLGAEDPRIDRNTSRVTLPVDGGRAAIAQAVRVLDDVRVDVDDIGLRRPTLDEVFLALTGEPIADGPDDTDGEAGGDHDHDHSRDGDRDREVARPLAH